VPTPVWRRELFWILAIVVSSITVISLLLVCCMCTRIVFAIKVMPRADRFIHCCPFRIRGAVNCAPV
jgi:hypothetical protein